MMQRHLPLVFLMLLAIGCARPGVAPGNAQRGYVVWGFLGQGTTTAAVGQQATLYTQAGQPVQTATSDSFGKFVFAYHQPGNYFIAVGNLKMPVSITGSDQRLDIDLNNATGTMDYAAGAAKDLGPPSCPNTAPPPALGQPNTGAPAEERDPNLVGSWGRTDTLSSGDASLSTKLSLLICSDGSYSRTVGDSVGGGAGWSSESRGSDSSGGRWRSEAGIIYIQGAAGWEPYARYYVEGAKLMLTFANEQREIWYR